MADFNLNVAASQLNSAIAAANAAAPQSTTYTKSETDALLSAKVDKVQGKGLSENDYTDAEKAKLSGIAAGAEINVQSDWSQIDTDADDFIKNKPVLATVATSGAYSDLTGTPAVITGIKAAGIALTPTSGVVDIPVATNNDAGLIKGSPSYTAVNVNNSGALFATIIPYNNYSSLNSNAFISKGTLNNVINNTTNEFEAEMGAIEERGSKNLLKIENYEVGDPYTYGGRKFTVLADGGVKIETVGTVSGAVDFYLLGSWAETSFKIPSGEYKASLISTASAAGVQICVYDRSTGSTVSQLRVGLNDQSGADFNFGVTTAFISVAQNISTGENGIVVYPMIRPAAMQNPGFAQYAPTNRELYEMILALQAGQ